MAKENQERKSKLEKAQESLYDKHADIRPKKRAALHKHAGTAPEDWDDVKKKPRAKVDPHARTKRFLGWVKKFFIIALVFFIIAIGYVGIRLWQGNAGVSSDAVDIAVFTQNFVDGGESFDVVVRVTNNNSAPLELADLVMEYPRTSLEGGDVIRERIAIDTIKAGESVERDFKVALFGQEGERRPITAKLEYRVAGSNAIFVTEATEDVAIQSTPITLTINGPETSVGNQEIEFTIDIHSNSSAVSENVLLRADYPVDFTFGEASPRPAFQGNAWLLGDIAPGAKKTITLRGVLAGETGSEKAFKFMLGTEKGNREGEIDTLFNSISRIVRINSSFIQASIDVNGSSDPVVAVPPSDDFDIEIMWANTLPVSLQDVKIVAALSGSAYQPASVRPDDGGFFDSNTDTVVWDGTNTGVLDSIEPGEEGSFGIEITPRPLVQGGTTVLREPSISVDISIEGTNIGGNIEEIQRVASSQIKIITQTQLEPRTLYYGGPFQNGGPMPPKVGEETEYTLAWRLSNTSSRIENGKVITRLPSYVEWKKQTSPASENLEYNSVTRELAWNVGTIDAGAGFSSSVREVFFKVGITPSTSQQNSTPSLTESLVFTGLDTYTNETVRVVRDAHTTRLLNDISVESGKVQ